jgi:hypothetical protein
MIDVFAAFSLASAASRLENDGQLIADCERIYALYASAKEGKLTFREIGASDALKTNIEALGRISAVAVKLAQDPNQLKNIEALLASL